MDRILELSPIGATLFGGGWAEFKAERDARRARAEAEIERTRSELSRIRRDLQKQSEKKARRDKRGRADRASGGQPKVLLDARAQRAEKTGARDRKLAQKLESAAHLAKAGAQSHVAPETTLNLRAEAAGRHGIVLQLDDLCVRRGACEIGPVTVSLRAGERVAVTGPNGSGKTTLLTTIAGDLVPSRGTVTCKGPIALLDQQAAHLPRDLTLLQATEQLHPTLTDEDTHGLLAAFGFRGGSVQNTISELSGGERLRAGLAVALGGAEPPAVLMLDEPTNHLDLDTIAALEAALNGFAGTLIVTSHDLSFLDAIGIERRLNLTGVQDPAP